MARRWAVVALLLTVSGCGLPTNVAILLPEDNGNVGQAVIKNSGGTASLDTPYAAVGAGSAHSLGTSFSADRAEVTSEFGRVLAATPRAPTHFIVYFITGQAVVDPRSSGTLATAIAAAKSTPNEDISVVGHADATGSDAENLDLSLRRADLVRNQLVAGGVPAGVIEVTYHGANNPLVPTKRGVPEPRNRRVEITIR